MQLSLRSGEKLYLNGAVIRVDRKVSIELMNDVTFLLEAHVLTPADTTTPLRQLYFTIQVLLMDPASNAECHFQSMLTTLLDTFENAEIRAGLLTVRDLMTAKRRFEALKTIRRMFALEAQISFAPARSYFNVRLTEASMIVTPTSASPTSGSSPTTAASQNTVDYNSFLKLMVTQMQNQDPTAPMDSSQFLSQLASFSSVEQAVQSNTKLDSLISMSQISQADGIIGKTATSADGLMSGVVKSVRIDSNGVTANLDNGGSLSVTSGITISAP